jgi:hypothetical protein
MTFAQYVVAAAGFLAVCAVGLLAHRGALTISNPERAAPPGTRAAVHDELGPLESGAPAGRARDDIPWKAHLHIVDTELASGHVDAAVRAWHDAYGAALANRSWEGLLALGEAFMKIGHAAGTPGGAPMNAREAYVAALIRARRNCSVDGALRSAEAFAELGDRAIVEQSLYIAAQLAPGDQQAQQWVSEARQRWAGMQSAAGS